MTSGLRSVAAPLAVGKPLSGQHASQAAAGSSVALGVALGREAEEVGVGENSIVFGPPQAETMSVLARRNVSERAYARTTCICDEL